MWSRVLVLLLLASCAAHKQIIVHKEFRYTVIRAQQDHCLDPPPFAPPPDWIPCAAIDSELDCEHYRASVWATYGEKAERWIRLTAMTLCGRDH